MSNSADIFNLMDNLLPRADCVEMVEPDELQRLYAGIGIPSLRVMELSGQARGVNYLEIREANPLLGLVDPIIIRNRYVELREQALLGDADANFAYGVKADDWVICPSSTAGYLLAGKVIGEYVSSFKGAEIPAGARQDFVHMRKVRWLYVASKSDPRYKALHRIGILTVNQQKYGMDELQKILNGHLPSV